MNEALIKNWNSVVNVGDTVYHLGDFSFLPKNETEYIFNRLHGIKFLILGNHDHNVTKHWSGVFQYKEININGTEIVLMHYAMRVWNKSHHGSWHLYGHSHGTLPDDGKSLSFDVGVDCHNYHPISFEKVSEIFGTKKNNIII